MVKKMLLLLAAALAVAPFIVSGVARANPTATPTPRVDLNNVLSVNYYDNAGHPPAGRVHISNNFGVGLCANIYVTDEDQEMKECCSCYLSDKGTRSIDVNVDLTSNPANGVPTIEGEIAIISGQSTPPNFIGPGGVCALPSTAVITEGELYAFETHGDAGTGLLTETPFLWGTIPDTLAALSDLEKECAAIRLVGSGRGICTCGTGD